MTTRDIPQVQWPAFFDHFSRTHRAWLTTIDTGRRAERQDKPHPLRSVTPFVSNGRVIHIDIRFQDDVPSHEPLRITRPNAVRINENSEGIAQDLEIVDCGGVATRLHFRVATPPELLDGLAPGEAQP